MSIIAGSYHSGCRPGWGSVDIRVDIGWKLLPSESNFYIALTAFILPVVRSLFWHHFINNCMITLTQAITEERTCPCMHHLTVHVLAHIQEQVVGKLPTTVTKKLHRISHSSSQSSFHKFVSYLLGLFTILWYMILRTLLPCLSYAENMNLLYYSSVPTTSLNTLAMFT